MFRNIRQIVATAMTLLLITVVFLPARAQTSENSQQLAFLGIEGMLPAGWQAETPGTHMRLAQYRVPGSPQAQMVVYYFGPGQGGSVKDNAARWSSQFTDKQGKHVKPEIRQLRTDPPRVTLVELHGNYARGVGMGNDAPAKADHALLAAVVETPRGNAYIQLWGSEHTVSAARNDYLDFLKGLKPSVDSK